jgi:hypothetical protein
VRTFFTDIEQLTLRTHPDPGRRFCLSSVAPLRSYHVAIAERPPQKKVAGVANAS